MNNSPDAEVHEEMEAAAPPEKLSKSQLKRMKKKAKRGAIKESNFSIDLSESCIEGKRIVSDEERDAKKDEIVMEYVETESGNEQPEEEKVKHEDIPSFREEKVHLNHVDTKEILVDIQDQSDVIAISDDPSVYGGYLYKKSKSKTLSFLRSWSNKFVSVNVESGLLMVFDDKNSYDESGEKAKSIAGLREGRFSLTTNKESGKEFSFRLDVRTGKEKEESLFFAAANELLLSRWSNILEMAIGQVVVADKEESVEQGGGFGDKENQHGGDGDSLLNRDSLEEDENTFRCEDKENLVIREKYIATNGSKNATWNEDNDASLDGNKGGSCTESEHIDENIVNEELKVIGPIESDPLGSPELLIIPAENNTKSVFSPMSLSVDASKEEPSWEDIRESEQDKREVVVKIPPPPVNKPGSRPPPPPSPKLVRRRSRSKVVDYPDPKPHLLSKSSENEAPYGYKRESDFVIDQRTYHGNLNDPNPDIWTRSNIILAAREKMRDAALMEREEDLRLVEEGMQPRINKTSHHIKRNTSDMFEWEKNRKAKIEQKIKEKQASSMKGVTWKPELVAKQRHHRSKKLPDGTVVMGYGYDAEGEALPVHERMYAVQAERDAKRKHDEEILAKQMKNAKPQLNRSPDNVKVDQRHIKDVSNRMYSVHSEVMNRREEAKKLKDVLDFVPPAPKLCEKSIKIANKERPEDIPVEELLAYHGKLYEQKAQIRQALKDHNEQIRRKQTVALNKTSQRIVNDRSLNSSAHTGNSMDDSVWGYENRLFKPTGEVKQKVMMGIKTPSYHPKLNAHSEAILKNRQDYRRNWRPNSIDASYLRNNHSFNLDSTTDTILDETDNKYFYAAPTSSPGRFSLHSTTLNHTLNDTEFDSTPSVVNRNLHWAEKRDRKLQESREANEKKFMECCPFKPFSNDKKRASSAFMNRASSGSNTRVRNEEMFFERNNSWAKKKEDKIATERKIKEDSALDGCTFAPKIPRQSEILSSRVDDRGASSKNGHSRVSRKQLKMVSGAKTKTQSNEENTTMDDIGSHYQHLDDDQSENAEIEADLKQSRSSAASGVLNYRVDIESVPVVKRHMQKMTQGYLDLSHNDRAEKISDWLIRDITEVEREKLETFRRQHGEAPNESEAENSMEFEHLQPETSPRKSVGFKDNLYEMKTIAVNKDENADGNGNELTTITSVNKEGDRIDHPYYAEDLFIDATYPALVATLEDSDPPPPPPKMPPPPRTPPPQSSKVTIRKVGLDRDERRKSFERKAQFL